MGDAHVDGRFGNQAISVGGKPINLGRAGLAVFRLPLPVKLVGIQDDRGVGLIRFVAEAADGYLALIGGSEYGVHDVGVLLGVGGAAGFNDLDLCDAGVLPRVAFQHDAVARDLHNVARYQGIFVGLLAVDDDGCVVDLRRDVGGLRFLVDEEHLVAVGIGNHSGADDVALGRVARIVGRSITHGVGFAGRVVGAAGAAWQNEHKACGGESHYKQGKGGANMFPHGETFQRGAEGRFEGMPCAVPERRLLNAVDFPMIMHRKARRI